MKTCSRIVGMAVDPTTLFVYWELDNHLSDMIAAHFGAAWTDLQLCLCMYDVTDGRFDGTNAPLACQQRISPSRSRWYFNDMAPGRTYQVDLAVVTEDERLFCIDRSRTITLPRTIARAAEAELPAPGPINTPMQVAGTTVEQAEAMLADPADVNPSSNSHPYADQFDGYHLVE